MQALHGRHAGICTIRDEAGTACLGPRPAVPGQHPLPVQHFCYIASLRCPRRVRLLRDGPAACTTAALTPPLCYSTFPFRATEVSAVSFRDSVGSPQMGNVFASAGFTAGFLWLPTARCLRSRELNCSSRPLCRALDWCGFLPALPLQAPGDACALPSLSWASALHCACSPVRVLYCVSRSRAFAPNSCFTRCLHDIPFRCHFLAPALESALCVLLGTV